MFCADFSLCGKESHGVSRMEPGKMGSQYSGGTCVVCLYAKGVT